MAIRIDAAATLDALTEPALIVQDGMARIANGPARQLLGAAIEGRDIRLAIRHPEALAALLEPRSADIEMSGLGGHRRRWTLMVRVLEGETVLARLIDRSSAVSAERMRVDFVANASHELRTPLSVIIGYAEPLADDEELDAASRRKLGGIVRGEADRMLQIIEDLISLSRIEADRFVAPAEEVSLAEIALLAAEHGRELARQYDSEIELDAEGDLPAIRGDFVQLRQMLDNLVTNAIRYGCAGKGCSVRIGVRRGAGGVIVTVSDDGEGIAAEHLPRLTERFYRVDAARSRDSGGTGLGLAIVKHIVERHKGTLEIHSVRNQGTRVTLRFPVA